VQAFSYVRDDGEAANNKQAGPARFVLSGFSARELDLAFGGKEAYNGDMKETAHVEITPGTCSGRPRVRGTRVRVANIVLWNEQGQSPDEIVLGHPTVSLAAVHAALAFYFDNREAMDKQIAEDEEFVESFKKSQTVGTDAGGDSVSS